jgi:hypothetical protein
VRDQRYALVTHEGPAGVARSGEIKPVSKGRLMGRSFEPENRRLTRSAYRRRHRMGGRPAGARRAFRTPGTGRLSIPPPRKPHKQLSGLRMNRTTFELEIALLRSSPALWSIEF